MKVGDTRAAESLDGKAAVFMEKYFLHNGLQKCATKKAPGAVPLKPR